MISGSWRLTGPNYWRRPPLKLVWPSRIKGNEVGWDPVQTMARSCKKVRSKIDTFVRWMLWDEETAGWCKMSICAECAACSYRSVMWVSKEQWTFNFSQCAAKKTSWQLAAALLKLFRQLIFILHDTYGDESLSMSKLMLFLSTCWRSSDWDAGKSSLLDDDSSIMSLLGFPILTTFQTKFHQFYHVHWCFVVWPWSWLMKLIQRSIQPHLFHKKASIPPKDVSEATIRSSSSFSVPANNRAWYLRN